ncbi:hypothetical protein PC116_g26137 [Phytophthora cactorum]|uniref:Crinkler effector protein N-terminal domain-containing protein n=2 Tax=Phytophthora cactorum TaxID=29920 RepID=A0A8T1ERU0_9STRA|nr:hypothetical protein PC112_g22991 [Phytophthora cactorum]KAG2818320.1 hypothetical protein PC113_g22871 [Phytophthora cactorum]KAG2876102.1 hypothetical protein PC114_g24370 [Phytophthora cactorum]KAG2891571.1 hypothetical protein PC117_g24203 [Phytophthora cactorum]KAG2959549.1 hypothetical protein PC118_g22967 [Phytophthora cactorum]
MVLLNCVVVEEGSVIPIIIEGWETVGVVKEAIANKLKYTGRADQLRLFLAKTANKGGAKEGDAKQGYVWLPSSTDDVKRLKKGEKTALIEALTREDQELQAEDPLLEDMLNSMDPPSSRQIHVLVLVPGEPNQVTKDTRSGRPHSENRRKRWRELNKILDKNKKAKTNGDDGSSTGYSYVRWSEVKSVLDYERYKQERKPIPDHTCDFLVKYLKYASDAMNGYTDASREAKRYHFIAPVLIMLCSLFVDVKLEVEESVDGNEVHANGHFEFVLTRGKTKICIVEAKKNDFDQGKAQALIGCEAVADREGLYVVYGIVTDFMKWHLYRCGENSILLDSSTLSAKSDELDIGSMRDVCEMIYGALSDHEMECKNEKLCV